MNPSRMLETGRVARTPSPSCNCGPPLVKLNTRSQSTTPETIQALPPPVHNSGSGVTGELSGRMGKDSRKAIAARHLPNSWLSLASQPKVRPREVEDQVLNCLI